MYYYIFNGLKAEAGAAIIMTLSMSLARPSSIKTALKNSLLCLLLFGRLGQRHDVDS